jgi:diadenosine tetraphosphatase ApaH/serine/threonine PP2A family protein phosphatase
MRIALLSDIHGNREALTACLDHARANDVERYVFLGDYVGYGADPGFVVDTVQAHVAGGAIAVRGNHDEAIETGTNRMTDAAARAIDWTRSQLTAGQRAFLRALPLTASEADRLYVHANVDAPAAWGYITDLYSASHSLMAMRAQIAFCGHIHVPALYHMSATGKIASFEPVSGIEIPLSLHRRWLAVLGAVGQPRDGNPAACYAILDEAERGQSALSWGAHHALTYIRVPYDLDGAARKIRAAGLPARLADRLYDGS